MSSWDALNQNTMKKTITLLLIAFIAVTSYGQQLGVFTPNSMTLEEKSFIQSQGFPLTQYKFDSSEINAQLKAGLYEREKGKKFSTYGLIGWGAGLLAYIAVPTAVPTLENPNPTQAKVLLGSALVLGGTVTFVIGLDKKSKAIKKIQNANYQYSALKN